MKKTIIISAIALCFSVVSVNAKTSIENVKDYSIESVFKFNFFIVLLNDQSF